MILRWVLLAWRRRRMRRHGSGLRSLALPLQPLWWSGQLWPGAQLWCLAALALTAAIAQCRGSQHCACDSALIASCCTPLAVFCSHAAIPACALGPGVPSPRPQPQSVCRLAW